MANEVMVADFKSLSGIDVHLDAATVRNALARGNGKITDQEVAFFIRTCQAKKLDPFESGEVYLVKYSDSNPAQMVVGYHAYIRRADNFPDYRGFKAGITVFREKTGEVVQKEGTCVYKALGETLIGGWCRVYRKRGDTIDETFKEVSLEEYNLGQSNWKSKPATMISKVAISQAFRAAFPGDYEGIYTAEEAQASGAIPPTIYMDAETGEITVTGDAEPEIITQDQRREMFGYARSVFGENADEEFRKLLTDHGISDTSKMTIKQKNEIYDAIALAQIEKAKAKKEEKTESIEEDVPEFVKQFDET